MARYIANRPIYFGGALAFAAGHQVPADHVDRFGYDKVGWVNEVGDDFRGDDPTVTTSLPDNTPPDVRPTRFIDEDAAAVERAQLAHARGEQPDPAIPNNPTGPDDDTVGDHDAVATPETAQVPAPAKTTTRKPQPATGDTTTAVTEA
jgi:hypothetical protein